MIGARDDASRFIRDPSERVMSLEGQITTDGFGAYNEPIEKLFPGADHGNDVNVSGGYRSREPSPNIAR